MTLQRKLIRLLDLHTKAEVAKRAGITPVTLHGILKGDWSPRMATVVGLARVLGVSLDWLCDDQAGWPPVRIESESAEAGETVSAGAAA